VVTLFRGTPPRTPRAWTLSRLEGLNQRVRLIMRRAFGFHSAKAALALVMLSAGPIDLRLPWEPAA
jgi:transposase